VSDSKSDTLRRRPYASFVLTIAAIVLALTVLPSPWGALAVGLAAAVDVGETAVFVRWSRRRRAVVGVETLVGRTAVVVRPPAPRGQVKLDGEVWEARGPDDLAPGSEVVVTRVDGLVLEVEPASPEPSPVGGRSIAPSLLRGSR
jgi:membrane protein implicated in regulation of membrane protease activity